MATDEPKYGKLCRIPLDRHGRPDDAKMRAWGEAHMREAGRLVGEARAEREMAAILRALDGRPPVDPVAWDEMMAGITAKLAADQERRLAEHAAEMRGGREPAADEPAVIG